MRLQRLAGIVFALAALAGGPSRLLAIPTGSAHTVRDVCTELEPRLPPIEVKRAEAIKDFCKAHATDELTKARSEELLRLTKDLPELEATVRRFEAPVEVPAQ